MVHYTHSVFSECVAESQSQGGLGALAYASPSDFLHLAEARGLRLDSQRRVDGGAGARRRGTPGTHRGMGYGLLVYEILTRLYILEKLPRVV